MESEYQYSFTIKAHTHIQREYIYIYVCVKLVKLDCLSALMHAVIKVKQMECCDSLSCLMNVCTLFFESAAQFCWFFQLKRRIHAECHWGPHSVSVCICHLVAVKLLHCSFFNQTWKRTKGNNFPAKISQRSSRGGRWLTGQKERHSRVEGRPTRAVVLLQGLNNRDTPPQQTLSGSLCHPDMWQRSEPRNNLMDPRCLPHSVGEHVHRLSLCTYVIGDHNPGVSTI